MTSNENSYILRFIVIFRNSFSPADAKSGKLLKNCHQLFS
jgi:hypothetical protein